MISAMSNSNGGLFTALASKYGDESDVGAIAVISSNDGPFFEMMFMGIAGVATIPLMSLLAVIVPIIAGMILGNLDDKFRDFLSRYVYRDLHLFSSARAGLSFRPSSRLVWPGIILGLMTLIVTGVPSYFVYKWLVPKKMRRTSAVGAAIGTSAGNSIATPAAIAAVDPSWLPFAEQATVQVAASIIVTAILVPFLVDFFYRWELKRGLVNEHAITASVQVDAAGQQL